MRRINVNQYHPNLEDKKCLFLDVNQYHPILEDKKKHLLLDVKQYHLILKDKKKHPLWDVNQYIMSSIFGRQEEKSNIIQVWKTRNIKFWMNIA